MKRIKILIILGEPQSTFSEILFKYFSSKKFLRSKKKIILIGSFNLLKIQMKKFVLNQHNVFFEKLNKLIGE